MRWVKVRRYESRSISLINGVKVFTRRGNGWDERFKKISRRHGNQRRLRENDGEVVDSVREWRSDFSVLPET